MRTTTKRLAALCGLAVPIGLIGGGAAFVLIRLIALLTNLVLFHRVGWSLPDMATVPRSPWLVVTAVLGGLVVAVMARWSPEIRGHGLPEAMESVLTEESRIRPRTAVAKPLSAVVAIGTGGPFGAEGPIIVTGGAIGSLLGQVVPTSPAERKILLGCGAAAGMAATFGAPLAAVLLTVELLVFEYSTRALLPLVTAASVAAGVHALVFGSGPLFQVPVHDYAGLTTLPFYALLGLGCGLLAAVIIRGLMAAQSGFARLPVRRFWHPAIGALGFALIGLAVPRSLGVGYSVIGEILNDHLALGTVAVLGLAKLVSWWVALASGTSGGTLAPLLLISGCFGTLAGAGLDHLVPGLHVAPGAFALVAMSATFGAAIGATFTSIVFLFELTQDYQVILPLMLAGVVAQIVTSSLVEDTVMTEKLTRRGLHVEADYHADVLAGTTVGAIMRDQVDDVPADVTDIPTIGPGDPVLDALELLHRRDLDHLVVVAENGPVGVVSGSDILRARAGPLAQERTQAGTRMALPRRRRPRRRPRPHGPTVDPAPTEHQDDRAPTDGGTRPWP